MRSTGGSPENASFHSKGYRRYFEGYSEYKETLPNGRVKIRRIYTGIYHEARLTKSQRLWLRIFYCLLFAMAVMLFFYSVTLPTGSNTCLYVTIPQALSILGFLVVFYHLFNYMSASAQMTAYEFRSVDALKKSTAFLSSVLAVTGVFNVVYAILHRNGEPVLTLSCIVTLFLSALCCLTIRFLENRIDYTRFLSPNEAPPDSNQI